MKRYIKYILLSSAALLSSVSPWKAYAQDMSNIAETDKQITVKIEGATQGSGVIIKKEDNVYTVLTAWHVIKDVNQNEELAIITSDEKEHQRKHRKDSSTSFEQGLTSYIWKLIQTITSTCC